jgi:hypothetical protein
MPLDLSYLEGKRFCVVLAKLEDESNPDGKVKLKPLHGRANVDKNGYLALEHPHGSFAVPASTYNKILPSDGTEMLKDADYFVICRVSGMEI